MDCYDQILDLYGKREELQESQLVIGQILISLMRDLNEPSNYLRVRNCLILFLNLFFNFEAPDHYHKKGKSSMNLSKIERKNYMDLLSGEFCN